MTSESEATLKPKSCTAWIVVVTPKQLQCSACDENSQALPFTQTLCNGIVKIAGDHHKLSSVTNLDSDTIETQSRFASLDIC